MPHKALLVVIEPAIFSFGAVAFRNECGVSVSDFIKLLQLYLSSTFAEWNGMFFFQKSWVWIGSCIASLLSDLFLAHRDRNVESKLGERKIWKTFRFVDDYFNLLNSDDCNVAASVRKALVLFE